MFVMENFILSLKNEFNSIKKMGWIKSLRGGSTGVGYTFETLIGKKEDSFSLPDYNGIEIKTHRKRSKFLINLFSATPDGEDIFEIKRIYNMYGHIGKKRRRKSLGNSACSDSLTNVGIDYKFSLFVCDYYKKVFLCVYNRNNVLIDIHSYWTYDYLRQKLYNKMKYLAVIYADNKFINGVEHFKYESIYFYKLRGFDAFIDLIRNGKIVVTFNVDTFSSGKKIGQIHDHGTAFRIKDDDLQLLFSSL